MPIGYSGAPRVTGSNQASRTRRLSRSLTTGNNGTPMRMTLYSSEQFNYYASPVATNTDALRPVVEFFSTEFPTYSAVEIGYYKDIGYLRLKNMNNGAIVFGYNIDGGFTFVGDLGITGNVQVSGTVNVNGAVQLNSTLNTVGAVIFSNTLNTTGAVTFSSTLNTTGAVRFANTLNVEGAVVFNTTLNTVGAATFNNTVNVNTANGIDFNPGSDTNVDLLTVGVTGAPKLWWYETDSTFYFSEALSVIPSTAAPANTTSFGARIYEPGRAVQTNETNYKYGFTVSPSAYTYYIDAGVTDSGITAAFNMNHYVADANFKGTLALQHALRIETGIWIANASAVIQNSAGLIIGFDSNAGTIDNAYGVFVQYSSMAGTITNKWGLYFSGEDKSYFSGKLFVGATDAGYKCQIKQVLTNAQKDADFNCGIGSELDVTSDSDTSYQAYAGLFTLRLRGNSSESVSGKGFRAIDANMFNYGTGTNQHVGGFRLDCRNLAAGTVTNMYGMWIPTFLNSGGGTITSAYGFKADHQDAAASNYGFWSNTAAASGRWNFYAAGDADNFFTGVVKSGRTQTITGNATVNTNATLVLCNLAANATLTLTAVALNDGRDLYIKRIDNTTAILTVDPNGSEQIDGANTAEVIGQYEGIHVRCGAGAWWIV